MEKNPNIEWFYDYLVQFLKSPSWSLPVLQFIDDNCSHFDNSDENKLIYSTLFEKFQTMIDSLLETLIKELNISPEIFLYIVELGMKNAQDKIVFEQIFACNNFMSFKKLMTRRNHEIEVEVVREMRNEGVATEEELEVALEKQEIAEVGYALAMSIAWEEERRKKAKEAEDELIRVMKESEKEYEEMMRRSREEEEERRRKREEEEERRRREEEERRRKMEEDERLAAERRKQEELERQRLLKLDQEREAEERRRKEEQDRRDREELERKKREEEERQRALAEAERLRLAREEEERKRQLELRLKMEEMKRQRELELEAMKKRAQEDAERLRLEIEALNEAKESARSSKPRMSLLPMQGALNLDVLDINKGRVDLTKELEEAENLRRMTQGIVRRNEGNRRESVADREAKMQKQRELLLAKKKMEREQQIKEFRESGGIDGNADEADGAKDTGGFRRKNPILEAKRVSVKPFGSTD